MNIVTFGASVSNNFGGPSILYGFIEAIQRIGLKGHVVHYQETTIKPEKKQVGNIYLTIKKTPSQLGWKSWFFGPRLFKLFHNSFKGEAFNDFLSEINSADVIVDLWGIEFTDVLNKTGNSNQGRYVNPFHSWNRLRQKFPVAYVAHIFSHPIVKNTASIGPIQSKSTSCLAKKYLKKYTSKILCREDSAISQIAGLGIPKTKCQTAPDTALALQSRPRAPKRDKIGFSVSFQLEKQWLSSEPYVQCMAKLITHTYRKYNRKKIILIPNEFWQNSRDDLDVAKDIIHILPSDIQFEIIDPRNYSFDTFKKFYSECEVIIASRYHSCVAALASGTPCLALAWHDKYYELLKHFEANKYVHPNGYGSSELIKKVDELMIELSKIQKIIQENNQLVLNRIDHGTRFLFAEIPKS